MNIKRIIREEMDGLEWIRDQVNTKLAKDENWILVNDINPKGERESYEIQEYLFDLGYSWDRSGSFQLGPKPLCIYAIYHFGHDTNFANRIYYQSGCRNSDIRIANKDIESGKYMVYYWSDLKPKTITESDELDWIKNTSARINVNFKITSRLNHLINKVSKNRTILFITMIFENIII